MITGNLFFALLLVSLKLVSASPLKASQVESEVLPSTSLGSSGSESATSAFSSATVSASSAPIGTVDDAALSALLDGNKEFKASSKLSIAQNLTKNGPEPPFMVFECADNRVTAGTILHATLGTIFGQHNLGNIYSQTDANADAALVYGVEELGVKHIIVMGHYGCPTVGAALLSNATTTSGNKSQVETNNSTHNHTMKEVEAWIQPIREVYSSSNRQPVTVRALLQDSFIALNFWIAGFRALVEENVKASVARIQKDSILAKVNTLLSPGAFAKSAVSTKPTPTGSPTEIDVFVHGFVYDMETGDVLNLGVTFGPPGKTLPKVPFGAVASATQALESAHSTANTVSASTKSSASTSASASQIAL
ncbi:carbonic anhydrase [Mycena latifolia]|nr:carbonic anhydrase [Mycena latifolia]